MSERGTVPSKRSRTLGVLGGGQLGRMFVQAAQRMGFETVVLCPDASEPAAQISHQHLAADYGDAAALDRLAHMCCAVTTEFENVPAQAFTHLSSRCAVSPPAHAVSIAQDRILEKAHFVASAVATAPYVVVDSAQALQAVPADFYPAILKTARLGYDGKGQITVHHAGELEPAWDAQSRVPCVLERRLDLAAECSVLLARDALGQVIHWPVQHNVHEQGILATTAVGKHAATPQEQALIDAALRIAQGLNYVGVLCIEFFILADGSWVVNEMAPRPHNSGHATMDASSLSQFDAQVRVCAGLPLPQPRQHSCVVMLNLLGDVWQGNPPAISKQEPAWDSVLALGSDQVGVHLHLYGKEAARAGRKMGHINITADTLEQAWTAAASIKQLLR